MTLKKCLRTKKSNACAHKKAHRMLSGLFMSLASEDQLDDADNHDQADDENNAGGAPNKLQHTHAP